ncbi:HAD family hydrolase [Streptomyces litchfieldiae]|uniref:HAD family phosphatase n=1 Tax=Streptomyces litchfieldiae TaxID=3075543 RepID=A0ABU2MW22_9ACTN|nr:HAD family phosphatase [Streptomyces sp. DSM 44938]MDT0345799.1 HAD family phosphatase [Streptomyces sp. DSM 44938]
MVEEYKALIVDWDGTLVDSQPLNLRSLAAALAGHGVTLRKEWYRARLGTSGEELLAELGVPVESVPAILTACGDLIVREVAALPTFPTVVGWVKRARAAGLPRAVASGGGGQVVRTGLQATGLAPLFEAVVTREAVPRGKPAPDLFLAAARQLGVAPERCLAIEDADEGLAAAAAAGMDAVDVRAWVTSRFT